MVEVMPRTPAAPPKVRSEKGAWEQVLDGLRAGMTLREALALVDLTRDEIRGLLGSRSEELAKAKAECVHYSLRSLHGIAQGNRGSWQAATYLIERQGMLELEQEIQDTLMRCTPAEERGAVLDNARQRLKHYFTRPGER